MFSFLNIFNSSKPSADKKKTLDSLGGKTLNLNSPDGRTLKIFNHKSPVSHRLNGNNTSFKTNCKATVTNSGNSFRIAQKAREIRSTTPKTDVLLLSASCTSENNFNNSCNGYNSPRDAYDKKRKLMETLDSFGVQKRTRQECGVDTFVNRRRKTIGETTDWVASYKKMDKVNNRVVPQIVMNAKTVCSNIEKKQTKRQGDACNDNHLQKRPRTRNNEILSSYSSSKFLLTPGQKRTYPTDPGDDDSPSRKHCKSCTCCRSTVLLYDDKNPLYKSDKTTETDKSDDLVTVAASRIFNRSGKTQVVKRISMKTILDEAFDDVNPEPYTSLEKIEQKKAKAQEKAISTNDSQHSSLIKNTNFNSTTNSVITPVLTTSVSESCQSKLVISSTTSLSIATKTTQSVALPNQVLKFGFPSSGDASNSVNTSTPLNLNFTSNVEKLKEKSVIDGKQNESQIQTLSNNAVETPKTDFNIIEQPAIFQSPKVNESSKNENINTVQTSKSIESISSSTDVSEPAAVGEPTKNETNENQNLPVLQFSSQSTSDNSKEKPALNFESQIASSPKQPALTFGTAKTDDKQSTSTFQFGVPKSDDKVVSLMQFGSSNVEKSVVPVMQFGVPKTDEKLPHPIASNALENTSSVKPIFSFGKNATENVMTTKPFEFQFGGPAIPVNSIPSTLAGSNTTALSASPFNFGKPNEPLTATASDAPKFNIAQSITKGAAPELQFETMSSSIFGNSSTDQTKTPFSNTVGLNVNNQDTKLVFGSQSTEVKPVTSSSGTAFNISVFNKSSNNATNPVFQFSSADPKSDEKTLESSSNTFQFSAARSTPSFSFSSSPPDFGNKKAIELNTKNTQFSTPAFGSQTATIAPFKFGESDKLTPFRSTFTSPNQPLQFHNKTETIAEPFKFSSSAPASNAFQFGGANKADNGPLNFGQNANAFNPSVGFNGFGTSASSQPTPTFGSVSPSQPSPFGSVVAPESTSSFGNVAPPSSVPFGSSGGYQFGSTNNSVFSNPSTPFSFGGPPMPAKPEGAFNFNAGPTGASLFQYGQAPSVSSPAQYSGGQPQDVFGFRSPPQQATGHQGSGQALFSIGAAPAGERRKAKAVRRRNN